MKGYLLVLELLEQGIIFPSQVSSAGYLGDICAGGGGDIHEIAPEQCHHVLSGIYILIGSMLIAVLDGLVVDGVEEMRKAVRQEVKYGSTWIKVLLYTMTECYGGCWQADSATVAGHWCIHDSIR